MNYDERARATSARMLNTLGNGGKGGECTISSAGAGTWANDTVTATTTTQTGSGVLLNARSIYVNGELVRDGDARFLLSPFNSDSAVLTAPKVGDRLAFNSVTYKIAKAEPLQPTGMVLLYDLTLTGPATA